MSAFYTTLPSSPETPAVCIQGTGERASSPLYVPITGSPDVDLEKIVTRPEFSQWCHNYQPRKQQKLILKKIHVERFVERSSSEGYGGEKSSTSSESHTTSRIDMQVTIERGSMSNAETKSIVTESVTLRPLSAAVLIVLRVDPASSTTGVLSGSLMNYNLRPLNGQGSRGGVAGSGSGVSGGSFLPSPSSSQSLDRPREYVVFIRRTRGSVGAAEHREILSGYLDERGYIAGETARQVEALCGLRFHENDLDDLTSLTLSAYREPSRSLGVAIDPANSTERSRLFLYRETVSHAVIAPLLTRTHNGATEDFALDVWALCDAWRLTTDARSLTAILLLHELRYHGLMPRYRARRDGVCFRLRRSPTFNTLRDVREGKTPQGVNLRVRVKVRGITELGNGAKKLRVPIYDGDEEGIVHIDSAMFTDGVGDIRSKNDVDVILRNATFFAASENEKSVRLLVDRFGKIELAK